MHDEQLNVVITAWRKFTQKLFLKSHHADFYFRFSIDEHLFILNIVPFFYLDETMMWALSITIIIAIIVADTGNL